MSLVRENILFVKEQSVAGTGLNNQKAFASITIALQSVLCHLVVNRDSP